MNKPIRIFILFVVAIGIISVRIFQEHLFFDPYLKFFENPSNFENISLNENSYEIMVHIGFRYFLNSILTLLFIYFLYLQKAFVSSSFFILLLIFVLLFPVYYYFVMVDFREHTLIGFYVRRIMIQPIILLLLVPSFYYLKK